MHVRLWTREMGQLTRIMRVEEVQCSGGSFCLLHVPDIHPVQLERFWMEHSKVAAICDQPRVQAVEWPKVRVVVGFVRELRSHPRLW